MRHVRVFPVFRILGLCFAIIRLAKRLLFHALKFLAYLF